MMIIVISCLWSPSNRPHSDLAAWSQACAFFVTGKVIWLVFYTKGIFLKRISTYLDTSSLKILPKICRFKQLSLHCTAGKATGNNLDDEDYVPEVPESPDPDSTHAQGLVLSNKTPTKTPRFIWSHWTWSTRKPCQCGYQAARTTWS